MKTGLTSIHLQKTTCSIILLDNMWDLLDVTNSVPDVLHEMNWTWNEPLVLGSLLSDSYLFAVKSVLNKQKKLGSIHTFSSNIVLLWLICSGSLSNDTWCVDQKIQLYHDSRPKYDFFITNCTTCQTRKRIDLKICAAILLLMSL